MMLLEQLQWRYATKRFVQGQVVSPDIISQVLEAVRLSPSSSGVQPYHVLVITDSTVRAKLQGFSYGQRQIVECSHLLVFCARTDFDVRLDEYVAESLYAHAATKEQLDGWRNMVQGDILNPLDEAGRLAWAFRQTYLALGFALSACAYLGIDSCPMEGFMPAEYSEVLQLPSHIVPGALLAIGYRSNEDVPRKKVRQSNDQLYTHI